MFWCIFCQECLKIAHFTSHFLKNRFLWQPQFKSLSYRNKVIIILKQRLFFFIECVKLSPHYLWPGQILHLGAKLYSRVTSFELLSRRAGLDWTQKRVEALWINVVQWDKANKNSTCRPFHCVKFFSPVSEPVDDQKQNRGGFDGRMKSNRAMKTATVASVTYLNVWNIKHHKSHTSSIFGIIDAYILLLNINFLNVVYNKWLCKVRVKYI